VFSASVDVGRKPTDMKKCYCEEPGKRKEPKLIRRTSKERRGRYRIIFFVQVRDSYQKEHPLLGLKIRFALGKTTKKKGGAILRLE